MMMSSSSLLYFVVIIYNQYESNKVLIPKQTNKVEEIIKENYTKQLGIEQYLQYYFSE